MNRRPSYARSLAIIAMRDAEAEVTRQRAILDAPFWLNVERDADGRPDPERMPDCQLAPIDGRFVHELIREVRSA
jgi:hypothetical protein